MPRVPGHVREVAEPDVRPSPDRLSALRRLLAAGRCLPQPADQAGHPADPQPPAPGRPLLLPRALDGLRLLRTPLPAAGRGDGHHLLRTLDDRAHRSTGAGRADRRPPNRRRAGGLRRRPRRDAAVRRRPPGGPPGGARGLRQRALFGCHPPARRTRPARDHAVLHRARRRRPAPAGGAAGLGAPAHTPWAWLVMAATGGFGALGHWLLILAYRQAPA